MIEQFSVYSERKRSINGGKLTPDLIVHLRFPNYILLKARESRRLDTQVAPETMTLHVIDNLVAYST